MKKILLFLLFAGVLSAQTFTVKSVNGEVSYQTGSNENWTPLKSGAVVGDDVIITTGDNSSVVLIGDDIQFKLDESSAVSVSNIKKMNIDDLLLALAMEDMMNAPKEIEKSADNTAVYGTKENEKNTLQIRSDDFGIKRLNGAIQLAKNGMEESAVIAAKETYRKYPDTKKLPSYKIYFADILYNKGLYEEALEEYNDISKLNLSEKEKGEVNSKMESIRMKLLNE